MKTPKGRVIQKFLDFLSRYVPVNNARLATLGGEGVEAGIWEKAGVAPKHGWLIESSRRRQRKLVKNTRFLFVNRLSAFHNIVKGLGRKASGIDGFHLDLCGTLHGKVVGDFALDLPLVFKSKGKCLAITVADARRNITLEQWPDVMRKGGELFGNRTQSIIRKLEAQQRNVPVRSDLPEFIAAFDPLKAARREFGLLVEIAQILKDRRIFVDVMERYIYVSRYSGHSFRMRTYFFHFNGRGINPYALVELWLQSPLSFYKSGKFVSVHGGKTITTKLVRKGVNFMGSKLLELVTLIGGEMLAEYKQLASASDRLAIIQDALGQTSAPRSDSDANSQHRRGRPRKLKEWKSLSTKDKILLQLRFLELKSKNGKRWPKGEWNRVVIEEFGHRSVRLRRSLRAALAHTGGKFRNQFTSRIKKVFGVEAQPLLDRLQKVG